MRLNESSCLHLRAVCCQAHRSSHAEVGGNANGVYSESRECFQCHDDRARRTGIEPCSWLIEKEGHGSGCQLNTFTKVDFPAPDASIIAQSVPLLISPLTPDRIGLVDPLGSPSWSWRRYNRGDIYRLPAVDTLSVTATAATNQTCGGVSI